MVFHLEYCGCSVKHRTNNHAIYSIIRNGAEGWCLPVRAKARVRFPHTGTECEAHFWCHGIPGILVHAARKHSCPLISDHRTRGQFHGVGGGIGNSGLFVV